MRVLMSLAIAVIAAVGMSGCQSAMVCSSCDTGCGSEIAPTCGSDSAASGCGCGSAVAATPSCGCSASAGASDCGCGSGGCDGGCGGACDGNCGVGGGGLLGRLAARSGGVSTGEYVTDSCADGSCGTGGFADGSCADGSCGDGSGVAQTGGLLGSLFSRRASTAGYETAGCGVGGCGMGGHLCGRCRALSALRLKNRAAANHPYGGMSPHTPPQTGPYGAMAPNYGYPYYTTRGPRDFFEANPPSLGR